MGEQARFILNIFVITTCIVIPIIDSKAVDTFENERSQLDGHDISGSFVDVCCDAANKNALGFANWERNESGHVLSKYGISIEMMDWLALSMKFEYECLPIKDSERFTKDEKTNITEWTSLHRLKNGMCPISLTPFAITYTRFKDFADFLLPFVYTPFNLLIPVPRFAVGGNISSVWKPFEVSVWIALLLCIAVTMVLSITNWLYKKRGVAKDAENRFILELHWLFVFGLFVSKAGFRAPNSFKMRIAGGAWCIAALILTNYYSSVLTSFITVSIPETIANSVEEVANNDNIKLVILKGFGAAATIVDGKDNNPLLKKLDKKLKSSPNSLCSNHEDCFRQVVEQNNTVFLNDQTRLFGLVSEDYRRTGRCNAAFAKEPFGMTKIGWAISKNYLPYETYQRGILRMVETGLVDHWFEVYLPNPVQCMVDPSSRQAKLSNIRNPALVNLRGLFPAFLYLLLGFILASIALFTEWITRFQLWKCFPLFRSPSRIEEN